MSVHTFVVVGASDTNASFDGHPEYFEDYVLETLRSKKRILNLDVRPIGDELAAKRGENTVRSVAFTLVELYTPPGEFSVLAQETETNQVIRITVGETVSYALVKD